MTIQLRSNVIRGSAPGNWRSDTQPFTRWPETPRYCPCGTRLRRTKTTLERLCDACDDKHRAEAAKRDEWFLEHGV